MLQRVENKGAGSRTNQVEEKTEKRPWLSERKVGLLLLLVYKEKRKGRCLRLRRKRLKKCSCDQMKVVLTKQVSNCRLQWMAFKCQRVKNVNNNF